MSLDLNIDCQARSFKIMLYFQTAKRCGERSFTVDGEEVMC